MVLEGAWRKVPGGTLPSTGRVLRAMGGLLILADHVGMAGGAGSIADKGGGGEEEEHG